ncbi:MAG: hypothetical protein AB1938_03755 [Myxococcota bacterium]
MSPSPIFWSARPGLKCLLLVAPALVLAACVDPTNLKGYECSSSGTDCVAPQSGGGGGAGGSGGGAVGGGGGGGGGGSGGGASGGGGGAATCDAANCTGCCDGATCVAGNQPNLCGLGGNACVDCGSGQRCNSGVCEVLVSNGGACTVNEQCASTFCAAGTCCESVCSGPCQTCAAAGSEGRCTPLPENTAAAACGDYACDGINGACPTTCTTPRQCAPGRYCNPGGQCVQLKANGEACQSSPECTSTFCADGVCCDSACTGSCDRCNLPNRGGACSPAPANDPGAPACGGSIVCNGNLPDCPILCSSGCPPNTFCSGMYCAAKKTAGAPCGAAGECLSNFCVDGVCCDSACAGACDACSVAAGAPTNGACALLGAARVCRATANACDVEERCSGTSPDCPTNALADAGTPCGQTTYTGWDTCNSTAGTCSTSGTQSRTRTDQTCNASGACSAANSTETQACTRVTDGASCGMTTYGPWSACSYADACTNSGSRTRTRTDAVCAGGACTMVNSTETDTAGCARNTNGASCGSSTFGSWGACSFGSTCAETGTRTRMRTDQVCNAGACGPVTSTETDTTTCTRSTTGQSCGTTQTGAWGSCSYGSTCATSGSRTRTVTTYTCGMGACNSSATTETDTSGCSRTTTGNSCGTTSYGGWTACSYSGPCANSGSRTRSVTTYACNGSGSCQPSSSTETDTAGCNRNQNGQSCGTTQYGSWGACSYADTCTNSGTRSRSVTDYTCGGGSCNASTSTENDSSGCARNTDGISCGADQCSTCTSCVPDCIREQDCTIFRCGNGTCNTQYEYRICGSCPPSCQPL